MYRLRYHMVVRDLDGWNEAIDLARQVNEISKRLGLPTGTLWTETVGPFNHLIFETDYESLALYESSFKALMEDSESQRLWPRFEAVMVPDKGYTELLEHAAPV
jgi:hypothetical protein